MLLELKENIEENQIMVLCYLTRTRYTKGVMNRTIKPNFQSKLKTLSYQNYFGPYEF